MSSSDVSATFSVTGGTADASDLSTLSGTVVVPAGATSASLPLTAVGDHVPEPDETATVALSSPVNATLGNNSGTLTLVDDDAAVGALVITEFLANPIPTNGAGEWVELMNVSARPINLTGLRLLTQGVERCTLSGSLGSAGFHVASPDPLVATSECADLFLPNGCASANGNSITIASPDTTLDQTNYCTPDQGNSQSLDPDHISTTANDTQANFCLGSGTYGLTSNEGTPGAANAQCP